MQTKRILLALSAASCIGGPNVPEKPPASISPRIVGGEAEQDYDAVGYLLRASGSADLTGPACGITLIAADLVVTAAHCVTPATTGSADRFAVSFGENNSGPRTDVAQVYIHPQYDASSATRWRHDVAVLKLSRPVSDRTPAQIGDQMAGGHARYIGYGRVTEGPVSVTGGYTGERKSAEQVIDRGDDYSYYTHGVGGGLCWGDSGGALMVEGTGTILGVLSDFDAHQYVCQVGNSMIFTALAFERSFIDQVRSCAAGHASDCPRPTQTQMATCQYRCRDYDYAPGQCYGKWQCNATGCLEKVASCGGDTCEYACGEYGYAAGQCYQGWSCEKDGCLAFVETCEEAAASACAYRCDVYGYAPGQCYQGWLCDPSGCVEQVGSCPK